MTDSSLELEISSTQVKALEKRGEKFTLLDVREPWECEASHLEGAKLIPMGDIPTRAHQELDPEDHIIVMCHRGMRSLSVAQWLRQQGFEKVQSMRGGIDGWARTVDPKIPLY
jgi:rhodanese-related sulfurtransferase